MWLVRRHGPASAGLDDLPDPPGQQLGTSEVLPGDPDAHPARELADELLATLLAQEELVQRLARTSHGEVLLPPVDLGEHTEPWPREVDPTDKPSAFVVH